MRLCSKPVLFPNELRMVRKRLESFCALKRKLSHSKDSLKQKYLCHQAFDKTVSDCFTYGDQNNLLFVFY